MPWTSWKQWGLLGSARAKRSRPWALRRKAGAKPAEVSMSDNVRVLVWWGLSGKQMPQHYHLYMFMSEL